MSLSTIKKSVAIMESLLIVNLRCLHVYIVAGIRDVIHASICHQDAEDCLVHAGLGKKLWGMLVAVIRKGQVTSILNNKNEEMIMF